MKKTIIILTFLIISSIVKADCLACWELRKVEITQTSGEIIVGFVRWNESWLGLLEDWQEWENKFPESLLQYHRVIPNNQDILIITKLTSVKNDSLFEFKATRKEDRLLIQPEDIVKIVEIEKENKKYQGAGDIPIFTDNELKKLKTNPFATFHTDANVADIYFLSYNKEINKQMLKEYSESNYWASREEFAKKGVITIMLSYD